MISNPRDLVVQLLGELLFVERRLADAVLPELAASAGDGELRSHLEEHRAETRTHVERLETTFRLLEVAPTSNLCRAFESAVAQHASLAATVVDPELADLFHAQAALHTEHWELAAYEVLLALVGNDGRELLQPSLDEEQQAGERLRRTIGRLAGRSVGRLP